MGIACMRWSRRNWEGPVCRSTPVLSLRPSRSRSPMPDGGRGTWHAAAAPSRVLAAFPEAVMGRLGEIRQRLPGAGTDHEQPGP